MVASILLPLQALCDLIVEIVFPTCAIFLLSDFDVLNNKLALSAMMSGEEVEWPLTVGSMAEGLTMAHRWGHAWSDCDTMALYTDQLGVKIPHHHFSTRHQPGEYTPPSSILQGCHGNGCLEYAPEGCPPAYTRFRVLDVQALMQWDPGIDLSHCVEEEDGQNWLNTARLNEAIMWAVDKQEDDPT